MNFLISCGLAQDLFPPYLNHIEIISLWRLMNKHTRFKTKEITLHEECDQHEVKQIEHNHDVNLIRTQWIGDGNLIENGCISKTLTSILVLPQNEYLGKLNDHVLLPQGLKSLSLLGVDCPLTILPRNLQDFNSSDIGNIKEWPQNLQSLSLHSPQFNLVPDHVKEGLKSLYLYRYTGESLPTGLLELTIVEVDPKADPSIAVVTLPSKLLNAYVHIPVSGLHEGLLTFRSSIPLSHRLPSTIIDASVVIACDSEFPVACFPSGCKNINLTVKTDSKTVKFTEGCFPREMRKFEIKDTFQHNQRGIILTNDMTTFIFELKSLPDELDLFQYGALNIVLQKPLHANIVDLSCMQLPDNLFPIESLYAHTFGGISQSILCRNLRVLYTAFLILENSLPETLEELEVTQELQVFHPFPSCLKKLTLPSNFNQDLDEDILPQGLITFSGGSFTSDTNVVFPNSLRYLDIGFHSEFYFLKHPAPPLECLGFQNTVNALRIDTTWLPKTLRFIKLSMSVVDTQKVQEIQLLTETCGVRILDRWWY